jgi:hypothetical protein
MMTKRINSTKIAPVEVNPPTACDILHTSFFLSALDYVGGANKVWAFVVGKC